MAVKTPSRRQKVAHQDCDSKEEEVAPLVSPMQIDEPKTHSTVIMRVFSHKTVICSFLAVILLGISLEKRVTTSNTHFAAVDENKPLEFHSGVSAFDDAFTLAMTEVSQNLVNGTFIAGEGWAQLWTRDTSYSVELATALLDPEASRRTLESCVHKKLIVSDIGETWLQDRCGHFGGWPHLTDAIVGAQGAWSLFLSTGDTDFLKWAHDITKRTLEWAERDVYDKTSGLFRGCSSFMESNSGYPKAYKSNGTMVGKTKALSTNVLYYNGYKIAAMMERELGYAPGGDYDEKASRLKKAILSRLWLHKKGYYAYFEDAQNKLVTQMEGLGEALLLLAPDLETNSTRIDSIFTNTYRTDVGIPCLWPRFDLEETQNDYSYYHNGRVWPFVQGYWAMAAAKHGKVDVFAKELEDLVRLSEGNDSQNGTFAEFYELDGSYLPQRRRQLWSSAGFLSLVFHGLFGVNLQPRGIDFAPVKPSTRFADAITLQNLVYRKARLTIRVSGSGSIVDSFKLNGRKRGKPFLPSDTAGDQLIEISLKEA